MAVRDRVLELRRVPASELRANPNNWRRHPAYQAKALRSILEQVGYADALLARETADGLELIDGHLRAETTPDEIVPVLVLDLDEAEAGLVLATLDPLAGMAETDQDALFRLLETVEIPDDDLARVLEGLTGQADPVGLTDPDDVPSLPTKPKTKPGDLWLLGEHRLLCGDATDRGDYKRLLAEEVPDMVWTDPPYGVAVSGAGGRAIEGDITNTAISGFFPLVCELLPPGAAIYMCGGAVNLPLYYKMFEVHCRMLPQLVVWDKDHFTLRHHGYHSQFELVFFGWTQGGGRREEHWWGDRKASDVWRIPRDGDNEFHPTQKPVELSTIAIERSAPPGGLVLEPFGGSGSALIAADAVGRRCAALELDPAYCDVIVKRWEDFTGKKAERVSA